MQTFRSVTTALFAGCVLIATSPLPASAVAGGLAWDSVTKIAVNGDPSSLQPGNFDEDFAAASAAQMSDQSSGSGGGIFGQMHQAMAMGQAMKQMMQTGIAERHYVAGSKERVDNLTMQTATITDCDARTITRLDLGQKTYVVESMDHPSSGSSGGGPGNRFNDNGTRIAISVTNTALGSRVVAGQPTSGYRSDATLTETSSSGETHTQNANLVGYYSSFDNPSPGCSRPNFGMAQARMGMMANYSQLMRAFAAGGADKRFTVTQSGPPLPLGRLAMYDAVVFAAQGQGVTFVNERGNVRALAATDPIFAIPPGFTQRQ
jgi:hypothetical protein